MSVDTPTRALGAQLSHMLKDRGVSVIFGIPGVHNQEMYRGIEESGLRHVLARHEQGAGFMADGYARATGRPGVAYVISGPGLCNIMTAMGQAYSDSVSVLVLSSCLDDTAARRGQLHQMLDQEGAARTVCDWSETARSPQAAYALIDRALTEFATQRKRTKHIQIPIALLEAQAAPAAPEGPRPVAARLPLAADVSAVAKRLRAARKPLFVFGGGATGAAAVARRLMARLGAASFTTYAGRGIIAADDPLHFGAFLARPDSARSVAEADLVVAVGTDLAEVDIWRPALGHTCPMIRVNIDAEVLALAGEGDVSLHCGAAEFLAALLDTLGTGPSATDWEPAKIAAARGRWRAEIEAETPHVLALAEAMRAALPDDALIYSDMTQFAYAAKEVYPMTAPGLWHHPYGFGTLGYAMPAAIGGKIGVGARAVVAIAGDYGFQYTVQELGVAVELGLPLPILIWDNGKLGAIEASMIGAQIAPNAVIQKNPDFCKLAEAWGANAARPATLAEFQDSVRAALVAPGPTIIHMTPAAVR